MVDFEKQRRRMVDRQLAARDITDERVLQAMATVPREEFLPEDQRNQAYVDHALPLESGQTISQPYIVAKMCQLLQLTGEEKVLDIGSGFGYEAAVLANLAREVVTIEIKEELAQQAQGRLQEMGYANVKAVAGNGRRGYAPEAPYEAIKSAAASRKAPPAWLEQLKDGGRIVFPQQQKIGQQIIRLTKQEERLTREEFDMVRFVPLVSA